MTCETGIMGASGHPGTGANAETMPRHSEEHRGHPLRPLGWPAPATTTTAPNHPVRCKGEEASCRALTSPIPPTLTALSCANHTPFDTRSFTIFIDICAVYQLNIPSVNHTQYLCSAHLTRTTTTTTTHGIFTRSCTICPQAFPLLNLYPFPNHRFFHSPIERSGADYPERSELQQPVSCRRVPRRISC